MSRNKTIDLVPAPKYGINEAAYIRSSALKGFLEPVIIGAIRWDHKVTTFKYRWLRKTRLCQLIEDSGRITTLRTTPPKEEQLSPFEVREEELIVLCEALPIQTRFIERELEEAEDELARVCGSEGDVFVPVQEASGGFDLIIDVPAPLFGINEVVYLEETATAVGRLEKMKVDGLHFDPALRMWVYTFVFHQKPGENATVGDRIDLREPVTITKAESELLTVCEAIPLRVTFLQQALDQANRNFANYCS